MTEPAARSASNKPPHADTGAKGDRDAIGAEELEAYVQQLFRLFKVGSLHMTNNQALVQTVDRALAVFERLQRTGQDKLGFLFLDDTVFINGRLLKADRDTYEASVELSTFLARLGFNELSINADVERDDVLWLASCFYREPGSVLRPSTDDRRGHGGVTLRRIDPEVMEELREGNISARDRMVRTYAHAVVVMRYVFDALKAGRTFSPRNVKRLVQQFALLASEDPAAFLGMTRMRNTHDDEAGRSVKSAIAAIALMAPLTDDVRARLRVGLAALLYDVGRPRAARLGVDTAAGVPVIPRLNPNQRDRLPASTAVVMTAVGRLHHDALQRTVIAWEAQQLALRLRSRTSPEAEVEPGLEARVVFVARMFVDAMAFDMRTQRQRTAAGAISLLRERLTDASLQPLVELLATTLRVRKGDEAFVGRATADQPAVDNDTDEESFDSSDSSPSNGVLGRVVTASRAITAASEKRSGNAVDPSHARTLPSSWRERYQTDPKRRTLDDTASAGKLKPRRTTQPSTNLAEQVVRTLRLTDESPAVPTPSAAPTPAEAPAAPRPRPAEPPATPLKLVAEPAPAEPIAAPTVERTAPPPPIERTAPPEPAAAPVLDDLFAGDPDFDAISDMVDNALSGAFEAAEPSDADAITQPPASPLPDDGAGMVRKRGTRSTLGTTGEQPTVHVQVRRPRRNTSNAAIAASDELDQPAPDLDALLNEYLTPED